MFHFYPLIHIPLITSGMVLLTLAVVALHKRSTCISDAATLLILSLAIWTFMVAGEMASDTLGMKLVWNNLCYLGIGFTPFLWFLFVLEFTGQRSCISDRTLALLTLLPICGILSCWTNSLHKLYYLHAGVVTSKGIPCLVLTHGPLFWVEIAHSYAFVIAGLVFIARVIPTSNPLFRRQMGAVMLGASIPFIGNILYIMGFHPVPGFDVTPVAFMITGIAIVWGVRHCRLWSMTPIAHRIILHTIADGIIVLDSGHRIVEINPAASYLVSFKEQIVVGRKIESVIPNEPELYEALGKTQQVINLTIASPNAPFGFFEVTVTPFHHASSRNIAWILVFHDMTERRRLEERLHFMAFYDSLTCLPNRELFTDQVEYILSDDGRCGKTALMYIDLDDFKSVNDLFGHSVGDNLLREVARRLNEKAKVSDMIARLCGDEFVVICTDLLGEKDALIAARRLMSVFSYPFDLPDGPRKISASIGCVFISEGGETVDSLLHSADMEMYEAKRSGGGQICISKKSDKGLRKVS